MTRSNRSLLRTALSRGAVCGLLVLAWHAINASPAAAGDGVVRVDTTARDYYLRAACPPDPVALGRVPFDRWYYLRLALGYQRVYPADINYSDPRDRRVYAAQGYGVPIAVPLPSNVVYQYNYSQGPRGSRLTPVSRPGR